MNLLLTQLLNINEVVVEDYRDIGEHLVLIVEAIKDSSTCPRCGQTSHNVHQSHFHLAHDLNKKELISLVKSRKHKDIKAELKSWGEGVLRQIEEVSIDMSGSYRGLIKKVLPNAHIVADRFHVIK